MKDKKTIIEQLNRVSIDKFFEGINIGDVLQLAIKDGDDKDGSLKAAVRLIVKSLSVYDYERTGDKGLLFLYLSNQIRNPHIHKKLNQIEKIAGESVSINCTGRRKANPQILKLYKIMLWAKRISLVGICFTRSLVYAAKLFEAYSEWKVVEKLLPINNITLATSIHDVRMLDNLFIQKINQMGIDTVALPHTLMRTPEDTFDFKCSHSKYFMVVDLQMKEEAIANGIEEGSIVNVCLPQYVGKTIKKFTFKNTKKICLFMGYMTEFENNKNLLKIVAEYYSNSEINFSIKFHPSDSPFKYNSVILSSNITVINQSLENIASEYDAAVVVGNSAVFLDMLFCGLPSFRYVGGIKTDFFESASRYSFYDTCGAVDMINRYYSGDVTESDMIELRRKYFLSDEIDIGYKDFFARYES